MKGVTQEPRRFFTRQRSVFRTTRAMKKPVLEKRCPKSLTPFELPQKRGSNDRGEAGAMTLAAMRMGTWFVWCLLSFTARGAMTLAAMRMGTGSLSSSRSAV